MRFTFSQSHGQIVLYDDEKQTNSIEEGSWFQLIKKAPYGVTAGSTLILQKADAKNIRRNKKQKCI